MIKNVETLAGKGTLHDTVGICYQNVVEDVCAEKDGIVETIVQPELPKTHKNKAIRRAFQPTRRELEPYKKKPKIALFNYEIKEIHRPPKVTVMEYRDLLWMISVAMGPTPMWAGWNSLITTDPLPVQKVLYMENLNLPPTRLDVVAETITASSG